MPAGDRSPEERRERFCTFYVQNSGNGKDAAQRAGWPPAAAAQRAAEMLRDPKITERISELLREKFVVEGQRAHEILLQLSKRSSPADAVKLRAAKELMTLGGLFQKSDARQQAIDDAKRDTATLKHQLMTAAGLMITQLAPDANGHQTGIKFDEPTKRFTVTDAAKAGAQLTYLLSIVSKLYDKADAEAPAAPPVVVEAEEIPAGEEPSDDEDDWIAE